MEKEYIIPGAQEILRLVQSVNSITKEINEDSDAPDNFIGNIDSYLEMINKLVSKCDEIDDESLSEDLDKLLEEVKEE